MNSSTFLVKNKGKKWWKMKDVIFPIHYIPSTFLILCKCPFWIINAFLFLGPSSSFSINFHRFFFQKEKGKKEKLFLHSSHPSLISLFRWGFWYACYFLYPPPTSLQLLVSSYMLSKPKLVWLVPCNMSVFVS